MQKSKLNKEVFDAIIRMGRVIKHRIITAPHADRFTLLQVEILMYLYQEKKTKSVDIAKHFDVAKSTTSAHLKRLEKSKIIKRFQDKKDRRIDWISMTQKGKNLLNKCLKERQGKINKFLTFISDDEKKQLLKIFKNLAITLEKKV